MKILYTTNEYDDENTNAEEILIPILLSIPKLIVLSVLGFILWKTVKLLLGNKKRINFYTRLNLLEQLLKEFQIR